MTISNITFASRDDRKAVELGTGLAPKFDKDGLIPAITVDYDSGEVLMLAYMNETSLRKTIEIGEAVYYSRSRQELWHKGATSGNALKVKQLLVDCDQDALVLRVQQVGAGCCHNGYRSCFYREIPLQGDAAQLSFTITEKGFDPEKVYGKK